VINSTRAHAWDKPLGEIYDLNLQVIPNFPATARDVRKLNGKYSISWENISLTNTIRIGAALDALLASMGLPLNGNVETRRTRFANNIGLNLVEQ